jgi:hypothetical protein
MYDCTWQHPEPTPPDDMALSAEQRWELDAAHGRLHVRNWDMFNLRTAMTTRGMLAAGTPPPAPDPRAFGLRRPVHRPEDDPATAGYWEAREDWLQARSPLPGISIWKLASNEGWLVTPAEIADALERAQTDAAAQADWPLWDVWLRFLRGAGSHGGFRVD